MDLELVEVARTLELLHPWTSLSRGPWQSVSSYRLLLHYTIKVIHVKKSRMCENKDIWALKPLYVNTKLV